MLGSNSGGGGWGLDCITQTCASRGQDKQTGINVIVILIISLSEIRGTDGEVITG